MQALATGKSWLSDKTKLRRLSQLTKVRRIQQQLDRYLKIWEDQPTIFLEPGSAAGGFRARVAQYEFHSMDALKEKLTQFPSETKFFLSISPAESADQRSNPCRTPHFSQQPRNVHGGRKAHLLKWHLLFLIHAESINPC